MLDQQSGNPELAENIARDNGFVLHKKYTEQETADLLGISVSTLRRHRGADRIAHIRMGDRCISFFGYHITDFLIANTKDLITKITCPNTDKDENFNSEIIGCPSNLEALPGAEPGLTDIQSKRDALVSAQQILRTQRNG